MTGAPRWLVAPLLVVLAVLLQAVVLPHVAIDGVVPNLALLLVVAAALVRGPEFAAVLGFGAGLVLDLAPPADHVAGRWALALTVVGFLAGRVRADADRSMVAALITVAASSFVGTSIYALSGVLLDDDSGSAGTMLAVVAISVVIDLVVAPLVLPLAKAAFRRAAPPQVAY